MNRSSLFSKDKWNPLLCPLFQRMTNGNDYPKFQDSIDNVSIFSHFRYFYYAGMFRTWHWIDSILLHHLRSFISLTHAKIICFFTLSLFLSKGKLIYLWKTKINLSIFFVFKWQMNSEILYLCFSKLNVSFIFVFKKQMKSFTFVYKVILNDHPYIRRNFSDQVNQKLSYH
jgi:hypothetical protein